MPRLNETFVRRDRLAKATEWHTLHGVSFLVASSSSDEMIKSYDVPDHVFQSEGYFVGIIAEHTLLDWKNLDNDDGTPMACTTENKVTLLAKYAEVLSSIVAFSRDPSNFISANSEVDEEIKNS